MARFFTVILYDKAGTELALYPEVQGMKAAKIRARYLLTDEWAEAQETTHERMQTHKVAIFADGQPTGPNTLCEWDQFKD